MLPDETDVVVGVGEPVPVEVAVGAVVGVVVGRIVGVGVAFRCPLPVLPAAAAGKPAVTTQTHTIVRVAHRPRPVIVNPFLVVCRGHLAI